MYTPCGFPINTVIDLKCLAMICHPLTGVHVRKSVEIPVLAIYTLFGPWVRMFLIALSRENEYIH